MIRFSDVHFSEGKALAEKECISREIQVASGATQAIWLQTGVIFGCCILFFSEDH